MKGIYYKIVCRKRLNHLEFNLGSEKLELIYSDNKYYYFKSRRKKQYYKVLKIEKWSELDIYENYLKN